METSLTTDFLKKSKKYKTVECSRKLKVTRKLLEKCRKRLDFILNSFNSSK